MRANPLITSASIASPLKLKNRGSLVLATLLIGTLATTGWGLAQSESAAGGSVELYGKVQGAGSPISGSIVTLYATGEGEPVQIANAKSGEDGSFRLDVAAEAAKGGAGKVFYVVARGGSPKAVEGKGPDEAIALMDVLGLRLPKTMTVNELTTVASAFTSARFINGESISGKPLGLKIAAAQSRQSRVRRVGQSARRSVQQQPDHNACEP